jgi:UDP-3-O-[3-hydroxymyristoyl] N-acetylglucosamine deacetylase
MERMRTIGRPAALEGVGVHSGAAVRLRLLPSEEGRIVFRRTDLGGLEAPLSADKVESPNSTALVGRTFRVQTIEHLLGALYAFGVGSLTVELDADEIPILDGSARPFAEALAAAGIRGLERPAVPIVVGASFAVEDEEASVEFLPPEDGSDGLTLSYTIVYGHPAIGTQSRTLPLDPETFRREIAPARTFGFLKDVDELRRRGLARGASMDNTVVLDERGIVNGPLRFPDEFVRHKLLDLAGDLALLGRPLRGRVVASRAGHRLHHRAVRALLDRLGFSPSAV